MDYKGFKVVTAGTRGYKRIERIKGGYNGILGLRGVPRG